MDNTLTQEIKDRLPIEEVVSWYLKLDKTGINMKGKCPFHNEKTASFFVSPERGSFYCFGCQKGGDIFTFVEEIEGVDFKDALKILAEKSGVDISKYKFDTKQNKEQQTEKDILLKINEEATKFFEKDLSQNKEAKEYLNKRGVENKTIKSFRVGFIKDEWQRLYDHLKSLNYNDEILLKSGLVLRSQKGTIYDRFRGRIVFPIFDEKGDVIAYSARILTNDKDQPKYINSPETPLFNKSKTLYGFNFAKQTIRKHDFAILVEGQLDVIMTHQLGYTNTVASSGTSFTEDQLKIIKRHTNNLLISFDGDNAGIKSSRKVWEMALNNEMDVKVIPLEEGSDPADVISKSVEEWKKLVKKSEHIIEYLADNIMSKNTDSRKKQKELQSEIYPYVRSLKSFTDKAYFVDKLSERFGIDKEIIWADINSGMDVIANVQASTNKKETKDGLGPKQILYGLYLKKVFKDEDKFLNSFHQYVTEDEIQLLHDKKEGILFKVEEITKELENNKKLIIELSTILKITKLEKEKRELNEKIKKGENFIKEITEISRKIETVKKEGCNDFLYMV